MYFLKLPYIISTSTPHVFFLLFFSFFFSFLFIFYLFIYLFLLFRAAPVAYGSSQARARIGAIVASLRHGRCNEGSKLCLQPHHSSLQCCILNPLSRAMDWTRVLMDISRVCFHWGTMGTPTHAFFNIIKYLKTWYIMAS